MYKITATIWDWNVNYLLFLHLSQDSQGHEATGEHATG